VDDVPSVAARTRIEEFEMTLEFLAGMVAQERGWDPTVLTVAQLADE
jgi:hypothetical protein